MLIACYRASRRCPAASWPGTTRPRGAACHGKDDLLHRNTVLPHAQRMCARLTPTSTTGIVLCVNWNNHQSKAA
jgi:hypothetical protein